MTLSPEIFHLSRYFPRHKIVWPKLHNILLSIKKCCTIYHVFLSFSLVKKLCTLRRLFTFQHYLFAFIKTKVMYLLFYRFFYRGYFLDKKIVLGDVKTREIITLPRSTSPHVYGKSFKSLTLLKSLFK